MQHSKHVRDLCVNPNVWTGAGLLGGVNTLKDRVKALRLAKGWTQQELANAAGVSQSMIGNIEAGTREEPRKLPQLAHALGVSIEELTSGKKLYTPDPATARVLMIMDAAAPYAREQIAKMVEQISDTFLKKGGDQ